MRPLQPYNPFRAAAAAADYANLVMADGPVAYWRLGEIAGPTAVDIAGGRNGTILGAVTLGDTGIVANNTAMGFDGSNGRIDIPYAAQLNPEVFTVECWARCTGGSGVYRSPVASRDYVGLPAVQVGWIIYAGLNDAWQFWSKNGGGVLSGGVVVLGAWTHLVAGYDGSRSFFWVNGVRQTTAPFVYIPNTAARTRIGAENRNPSTPAHVFIGDVDEVAIYPHVLADDRVAAHYTAGGY